MEQKWKIMNNNNIDKQIASRKRIATVPNLKKMNNNNIDKRIETVPNMKKMNINNYTFFSLTIHSALAWY